MIHTQLIPENISMVRKCNLPIFAKFSQSFYHSAIKDGRFPQPTETKEWGAYWPVEEIYKILSDAYGAPVNIPDRAINLKEIQEKHPRSDAYFWAKVREGKMPKPFKLFNRTFWLQSDIDDWLSTLE